MSKSISVHIRDSLHARLGIVEVAVPDPITSVVNLRRSEWSDEFECLMRDGLVMGALRYGRLGAPGKPQYNRINDMVRRLRQYEFSGNLEHLRDVANICLCEFIEGKHPKRHFKQVDDGKHTEEVKWK